MQKRLHNIFTAVLLAAALAVQAQPYTVGSQTITYTDPARSNRPVGVEFRYPGTNATVNNGPFPFVIFAHGFQMDQAPYYPYADTLAKQGYIVGLLTTETALFPSHPNFAQDLIFVYNRLITESTTNPTSPFYQKVIPKGALGGHSMGGGSTVLSCQYSNPAVCYFTFAAANTNPSSIAAAPFMTKPYLSFAGTRDCIAPVGTHQQPMYDASTSPCKFLINITDALHCQFGNGNVQCNFGEGFSGCASSPLSRSAQIDKTLLYLVPFLNYYLKGDCTAWSLFESRYAANTTDILQRNCNNIVPSGASIGGNDYFCAGGNTVLTAQPASFQYTWSDNTTADTLEVSTAGSYALVVSNGVCSLPPVSWQVDEVTPPTATPVITASDTVCSHIANIAITATADTTATGYTWTLPSGWVITSGANTNSIEVTSDTAGGVVSVTSSNTCGVSPSAQQNITVVPSNLDAPGAIAGDTLFCEGSMATFSVSPVSGADAYAWNYPAGWSAVGDNLSDSVMLYVSPGSGNISLQAVNSCGQSIPAVLSITVTDTPEVVIVQQSAQLVSSTSAASYQWYLNGVLIPNATDSFITPLQSGNYSLYVTDGNGCSGISEAFGFVYTGIGETTTAYFRIYPHPVTAQNLSYTASEEWLGAEMRITDLQGRIVCTMRIDNRQTQKHLPQLSAGVYVIHVNSGALEYRQKLVVQ